MRIAPGLREQRLLRGGPDTGQRPSRAPWGSEGFPLPLPKVVREGGSRRQAGVRIRGSAQA